VFLQTQVVNQRAFTRLSACT